MKEIKLLLVDDEKDFVSTLAERLDLRNLSSEVALGGRQAIAAVDDAIPDVMVLDLKMPGIDGMEVLRRVKKAYPSVQVIILTGHGDARQEREARSLGAFDYLSKPVEIDHLVERIRAAAGLVERSMSAAAYAEEGAFGEAMEMLGAKPAKCS